ncbi:MAG TPA: metallophosphoesterase [Thermomicrobiales bacterium]|nr:metallophosphoesterase [Thermomicrobiales bacterium]
MNERPSESEVPKSIAPAVDLRRLPGPFDIIGDIHGCYDELHALLGDLGYQVIEATQVDGAPEIRVAPPAGRLLVLLGDLVDRGPKVVPTLRLAMGLRRDGTGLCAPGNHDDKLRRWLLGRPVRIAHGLRTSIDQLESEPPAFCDKTLAFLQRLPPYLILDGGRLICAHAGLPRALQGRDDRRAREAALYGVTTGEHDAAGYPTRIRWAETYHGDAFVVYGHTPVRQPEWIGATVNIDTGCVFGGSLTALRWPERETVSVPALRVYDPNGRFDGRPTDDRP